MTTAADDKEDQDESGKFPMGRPEDASTVIQAGFEFGCPGADHHLNLRFYGQPGGACDGDPFPALDAAAGGAMLEPMLEKGLPVALSGLSGPPEPPEDLKDPGARRAYAMLLADRMAAVPVTARWYVMHDTGGAITVNRPPKAAKGAHLFVGFAAPGTEGVREGFSGVYLCNDYSVFRQATTKFEWKKYHREFRGMMVHNELLNTNTKVKPNPSDTYTDYQYECTAWSYVCASFRAGQWLTVTGHIEVDRGISNGHSDPRAFDFMRLYRRAAEIGGLPSSATFGVLPDRIGDNYNRLEYMNTFPAQYGPVQNEGRLRKTKAL